MAEATGTELALADDHMGQDGPAKPSLADQLTSGDMLRQIMLAVVVIISLAIVVMVGYWSLQPEFRPLAKLSTSELIETLDYLDANQIEYQLKGDTVYVRENEYDNVKLGLSRQGISRDPSSAGSEIIMQDMGFGVSQRVEAERLKHAREQQLARTIEELGSIARAKVLLAMPKENVFARREKLASATVVLTLRRGAVLSSEEVDAVVDIVASAVQGMEPSRVTVTDNAGRLLNSGSQDSLSARSRKEYELEKQREDEVLAKIDSILIPIVGLGNYTAQADVTLDFTAVEQTEKRFNPDLPAVRSEMTVEENSVGSVIAGIPGALTNQPPVNSDIPEQANGGNGNATTPGRNMKEATRNFELDTTISHTKQQTGVMRRLTVSVAVDYQATTDADGNPVNTPRSAEELVNIRRLLQGGLGFNVNRGDSLEVVSIPFNRADDGIIEEVPLWEQPWFMQVAKLAIGGLIVIVLIIFIVRPMLNKLLFPEKANESDDMDADVGLDLGDETLSMLASEFDESSIGFSPDGSLMMPDLHKDEDILKAVRALVANEPELSAQVVKGWLMQDE
ncbi:flagellar basal-body MS-ring/collar protein FliF [Bowmanella sp. JS7-9]|uniref:Flagellar M-ring protein n=1 Tax=Pseudobowmanella zhangzhouensis TaxID=1537679 RepID=A0ABW1XH62_9ALTE|nr:flagellar basal-body MS-ring/collar protein FliF [Bowmanella sp. JS7-9]TBX25858.1 flagellar M-ring protein FliF [Bowmanella sp. JS7-9]